MSTVFPGIFWHMAAEVGACEYEEALKIIDGTGFFYKKGGSPRMQKIEIPDADGYTLVLWFSPKDGSSVLSSVNYSDPATLNYEMTVTDEEHASEVKCVIYDKESDPKNTQVSGVEDLIRFFYDEMPLRMEDYREAVRDNEMLDVRLEVSAALVGEETVITVETNLPDETSLAISLYKDGERLTTVGATVSGGTAVTEGIRVDGGPPAGRYQILVIMKWPSLQPKSVLRVIGKNGEFLAGPYVVTVLLTPEQQVQRKVDWEF
jgi:hypothetical protein